MLKKWSRVALLAAATAFVLAAFGACMNSSEDSSGDSGSRVVAQYESEYGVLTFYGDDTFEFEFEDMSKAAAVARASRRTITGTYTGDPVSGTGLSLTASDGTTIPVGLLNDGKLWVTVGIVDYVLTKKSVSSGSTSSSGSSSNVVAVYENYGTASTDAMWSMTATFYGDFTFEAIIYVPSFAYIGKEAYGTYTGDPSKDGEITMTYEFIDGYEDNKELWYDDAGIELNKPVTVTIKDGKCEILGDVYTRQQ